MKNATWDHLCDELELLNALLSREVGRRTQKNSQLDLLQGFVLSEQEVAAILAKPPGSRDRFRGTTLESGWVGTRLDGQWTDAIS
jgi:hypothetical protein